MAQSILLTLPDLSPALAIEILPRGLVINRFLVNADGKTHDLVVGPHDPTRHGHHPHKYQNSIIGRYTNRIPASHHEISKDGLTAAFLPVPNESPRSSLHGGSEGFDVRDWAPLDLAAATLFSDLEKKHVSSLPSSALFSLVSPDGDQGFPGTLLIEVLFALEAAKPTPSPPLHIGSLCIVYRALLKGTRTVTPVNLTQHWGFNLDASLTTKGEPTHSIADHTVLIKASNTLALDSDALPTGALVPVNPQRHRIGDNPSGAGTGIDLFFLFDDPEPRVPTSLPLPSLSTLNTFAMPSRGDPVVELASPRAGLTLKFDSNQSGVQFYTANFFNGEGTRKPIHGWSGREGDGYGPQTFAFLEFHERPAAWLHPGTSHTWDTLLTPDILYNNFVRVDILFEKPAQSSGEREKDSK